MSVDFGGLNKHPFLWAGLMGEPTWGFFSCRACSWVHVTLSFVPCCARPSKKGEGFNTWACVFNTRELSILRSHGQTPAWVYAMCALDANRTWILFTWQRVASLANPRPEVHATVSSFWEWYDLRRSQPLEVGFGRRVSSIRPSADRRDSGAHGCEVLGELREKTTGCLGS